MAFQDDNGPWGNSNNPWGKRPNDQPDIEELIRKSHQQFKKMMPGGFGSNGGGILFILAIIIVGWLVSGFYLVSEGEQGAVLRFGKWTETTSPGLRYHLPYPVETVIVQKVSTVNRIDSESLSQRDNDDMGYMLTGDENLVSVNFTVLWFIKDLGHFLFNGKNPEVMVRAAAESAVREIIGQTPIASALTEGRGNINQRAVALLQKMMDDYNLGIQIQEVQLQRVDPPSPVIDAFRDVQRARADQVRLVNEAEAYRNDILPRAEGDASKIIQDSEAYRQAVVARAKGDASRFESILKEYKQAPNVTKERMYLETMQEVVAASHKIIADKGTNQGILPYLPLPNSKRESSKEGAK